MTRNNLLFSLLCLLTFPVFAVKPSVVVSQEGYAAVSHQLAGGGTGPIPINAFDGDESNWVEGTRSGDSILVDFSSITNSSTPLVFVSEIVVNNTGGGSYSLSVSEDGTNWIDLPDAQTVQQAGSVSFPVRRRIVQVKYFFISSNGRDLRELTVKGYRSSKPQIVSNYTIASFHNEDGSAMTADGGGGNNGSWGGTSPKKRMFDGNFYAYQMWPKAGKNGYVMVDFTKNDGTSALKEYYVTELWVGADGTKKFTLQYTEDGTTWVDVDGAVAVTCEGIGKYTVGKIAKAVRYVWTDGSYNNFSDEYLAEFQAWGMDPIDAPCTHPTYTSWGEYLSATCTERPLLARTCTVCGERFTKYADGLPLGHDYVSTLNRPGLFSRRKDFPDHRRYGSGSITCSRCSFRLDFPASLDLVTNRVGGTVICGEKTEGIVRFTDLSVSSENHPEWGPGKKKLIDAVWNTSQEWPYWTTTSTNGQYADFEFGTTIDLTEIELSVYNHGYHFDFCIVNDDSESETAFCSFSIEKDETESELKAEKVMAVKINPDTGRLSENDIQIWKTVNVSNDYQRIRVPFFETPVQHLRIRITDGEPTTLWGCKGIRVIEIHPWGTVPGASDFETEKTTLVILQ